MNKILDLIPEDVPWEKVKFWGICTTAFFVTAVLIAIPVLSKMGNRIDSGIFIPPLAGSLAYYAAYKLLTR